MNPMQLPRIEKLTLNIGAGKEQTKLDKAVLVLKSLTGIEPVKTVTQKRIAAWGLRPGLPIGCMITLRRHSAQTMLKRLLKAKEFTLKDTNFDTNGSISFGIPEHIDIDGAQYDPKIGVMGLQVCVTLEKPGYHIKRRSLHRAVVGKKHRISQQEAITFMKTAFGIKMTGETS
ncbi:MAG: 50S ribosomal protein L5 [Nanoarchaeota archaeon]